MSAETVFQKHRTGPRQNSERRFSVNDNKFDVLMLYVGNSKLNQVFFSNSWRVNLVW